MEPASCLLIKHSSYIEHTHVHIYIYIYLFIYSYIYKYNTINKYIYIYLKSSIWGISRIYKYIYILLCAIFLFIFGVKSHFRTNESFCRRGWPRVRTDNPVSPG